MPDMSKLDTMLSEGEHTVEIKLRHTFQYRDLAPNENTVGDAIDECRKRGELIDWEIDGD